MGRPAWQIQFITLFWPIRNVLARMVGWPIIGRWMQSTFRGDRASYIPIRVQVEPPESVAMPAQIVDEMIRQAPFRFILHHCLCRSLEPCRNYPSEIGCLFLGEGAREVAPSLGREATVEEALAHHHRAVSLGLVPMTGKLRWDSIWLGVKKAEQLHTICFCCDCCCYFKIYRFLPPEAAQGLKKLEGLKIQVQESCDGCGVCVQRCFIGAMSLRNGKAIVGESCRGCGRCALVCPIEAVRVVIPGR
jgi:Fe-S-cluster-containing hydrogenase component 2